MARNNMRPVDKDKVKELLRARGYSLNKAAIELGYTQSGLTSVTRDGTISERNIVALKYRFGIDYDDIKPEETKKEEEKVPYVFDGIPWQKIEYHIKRAVASALEERGL